MIRISKQIDREGKLIREVLVRRDVVFTTADDRDVGFVKLLLAGRERIALDGAAGLVVFRKDVQQEPLAFEVVKADGLAVLVLKFEIDEALTFCYCHICSPS